MPFELDICDLCRTTKCDGVCPNPRCFVESPAALTPKAIAGRNPSSPSGQGPGDYLVDVVIVLVGLLVCALVVL